MYESGSETLTHFKQLVHEKNKVIEELKFIINQKEAVIQGLMGQLKLGGSQGLVAALSGSTVMSQTLEPFGTGLQSQPVEPIQQHSHQKDQLIKELLDIIVNQLDWRKVRTTNGIIRTMLEPRQGTYRFDDGEYEGELVGGHPNGDGKTRLDNGDTYNGEYLHGKKNGKGVYRWMNGDVYEGDHIDGLEHGKGIYRYADGDVYIGDYLHGKRHGFGVLKLKSGTTEYGYFKDGQYNGKCIMVSPDEQIVSIGDLRDNKQDGTWKYYHYRENQLYVNGIKMT